MKYSPYVERRIDELIEREGGYVNHPSDKGGETKFGIRKATARGHGYSGEMRDLPFLLAKDIYREDYWASPCFDRIAALSLRIADELFDSGVLSSPRRATVWLQECLNSLNSQGTHYPDMVVDGIAGRTTRDCLEAYLEKRKRVDGELVLLKALNCMQGHHFIVDAVKHHAANEDFVFGWLKERVEI